MDIKLPKLGEGAESGTVTSILVKVGDTISEGQTILEVENEKAVAPIPASAAGRVADIRVKEGDKISVGSVLLTLEAGEGQGAQSAPSKKAESKARPAADAEEDEETSGESEADEPEKEAAPVEAPAETDDEPADAASPVGIAAAPSIRRLARDLGIELKRVRGSERGGRIILADLRTYIQRLQKLAGQSKAAKTKPAPTAAAPAPERIDFSKWGPVSPRPFSQLRQTIGRRMAENWATIPHVTQFDNADITALNALRKQHAPAYDQQGAKLTLTSFALKAVVETLKKHPIFNASLDEAKQELVFKEYFHLGLAVDTEQGLLVPVIRDVDQKDLLQLSKDITELAEKARQRKLSLDEMKGGTFTISNQGGIGGAHFTPIINKPEVAILGLGRGAQQAVVRKDGNLEARWLMPLALSYDHRVIDGGSAARFIVDLVAAFEQFPAELVGRNAT